MTSNESLSVFEKMITDISNPSGNTDLLDECMAFRPDMIKKIPLRFRLIALGFLKKYSLDEMNEKLKQVLLEKLIENPKAAPSSIPEASGNPALFLPFQTICPLMNGKRFRKPVRK